MGGRPLLALSIAEFPEELPQETVAAILDAADAQVREAGAILAGGHTIRDKEPKYGLAVVGTVHPDGVWPKSGARPGDALFLTKPLGTGLVLHGAQRGLAGDEEVRGRGRLDDDAEPRLGRRPARVPAERGHRRHRLRAARPRATRWPTGAACGSCSRRRAWPALDGALEVARAGEKTGGDRRNRDFAAAHVDARTASPTSSLALGWDPQTAGGLLVSLPADKGAALAGRARRARPLRPPDRPRRGGRRRASSTDRGLHSERVHVETTRLVAAARLRALADGLPPARGRDGRCALWLIVSTGAVVRLTSSGLGCEHWPGCQPGQPFPEKGYHSYIEFGNRMVASVTIVLTLALAVGAWFTRGLPRWARWLAVGDVRRHARAGAARRDHRLRAPAPGARHPAPPALDRGARRGGRRRARGARARPRARHAARPRAAARRALAIGGRLLRAARVRDDRHGRRARTRAARTSTGSGALHPALLLHGAAVAVLGCSLMFLIGYLFARRAAIGRRYVAGAVGLAGARARADGARRHPVPDASAVGARARPRRGRGDGLGGDGRVRHAHVATACRRRAGRRRLARWPSSTSRAARRSSGRC